MSSPRRPSPFFSDSSMSGVIEISARRDVTMSSRNGSVIWNLLNRWMKQEGTVRPDNLRTSTATRTPDSGSHRQIESLSLFVKLTLQLHMGLNDLSDSSLRLP